MWAVRSGEDCLEDWVEGFDVEPRSAGSCMTGSAGRVWVSRPLEPLALYGRLPRLDQKAAGGGGGVLPWHCSFCGCGSHL